MSKQLSYLVLALAVASLASSAMAADVGKGNILIEEWINTNGAVTDNVATLKSYAQYPDNPTKAYWLKKFERPDAGEDNWGGRIRGYLYPPQTGDYTFWTCSDDYSELYLSTDETPANATMIANVQGWMPYGAWDGAGGSPGTTFKSAPIKLTAGKKYYVESVFSDGTGGGFVSVGWGGPGIGAGPVLIDGKYLAPLIRNPEPMLNAQITSPADGAVGVVDPLIMWTAGATALWHDFYFGTDPNPPLIGRQYQNMTLYYHQPGWEAGKTYYWKVVEIEADGVTTHESPVWSFTAQALKAFAPAPANGATGLLPGTILSWMAGKGATKQQVFFGTDMSAVAAGDASVNKGQQAELTFNTGALRASTTYYWRVDTIKSSGTVAGDVWSFTTVDGGPANKIKYEVWRNIGGTAISGLTGDARYPGNPDTAEFVDSMESAVDWADSYGQRFWGWIKPPETGDYTFWISGDDAQELWLSTNANPADAEIIARVSSYTAARTWDTEAGQKSIAIPLKKGEKYFIMALGKEGTGGDSTAVAWGGPVIGAGPMVIAGTYVDMFALKPLLAFGSIPSNGAVDTAQDLDLIWQAGELATSHDVYFGDDAAAVAAADKTSPLFKGNQAGASYATGSLEWGKTYYWRVDEVDAAATQKGTVWSFTTANFIPVDNMESYNEDEDKGTRIYENWIDGYGDDNNGSTVGNLDPPFAERTIVHSGKQAMPMDYNNVNSPFLSFAEREFVPVQDWTANGVDTLSLWFRGQPVAFSANAGVLTVSGSGNDIWNNADAFRYVYKRLTGNGSITARVESLTRSDAWSKAGVMIRETVDPGSAHGTTVVTSDNGCSFQRRQFATDVSTNTDLEITPRVKAPYWVRITRTGNTFKSEVSADGKTWRAMVAATPETSSLDITMGSNVLIGLAVTSHNVSLVSTGVFTDVTTTGNVSGDWQVAAIGSDPQPGNSPGKLYVKVADSSKSATVASADTSATTTMEWTEWKIPLSSFNGVSLSKVKKLTIGVGDPANPAADGFGRVYIDDIRVTKP